MDDLPRLGLIGFGEVGSSFVRGFRVAGLPTPLAYDQPQSPAQRDLTERRSQELGIALLSGPAGLAQCDIVFSCVPQDQALAAARLCACVLSPDALYVDVNSLAPDAKQAVAALVTAQGRAFVDGAIMSMPLTDLHRSLILAAGEQAHALAQSTEKLGMRIQVVSTRAGDAAGIKILRSVVVKGLEALLVESLTAARRLDLDRAMLDSLGGLLGPQAAPVLDFLIRTHAVHARRRTLEIEMSAATLDSMGIDPLVTRAVAERLRRTAQDGLADAVQGVVPADIPTAIGLFDTYLDRSNRRNA